MAWVQDLEQEESEETEKDTDGGLTEAEYEDALARLPAVDSAQRTRVVHVRGFLSGADLAALDLDLSDMCRQGLGSFARDASGMPVGGDAPWTTWYLHTDGHFFSHCSQLAQRMRDLALSVDRTEGWGLLTGNFSAHPESVHWRTVELHEVRRGGALADPCHFDGGSLVTIDIMLGDPGADFDGGGFATPEAGDTDLRVIDFRRGDALVFVSHKRHCVQHVTRGCRRVLVAELWEGPERTCAHRCLEPRGECIFSTAAASMEKLVRAKLPMDD